MRTQLNLWLMPKLGKMQSMFAELFPFQLWLRADSEVTVG